MLAACGPVTMAQTATPLPPTTAPKPAGVVTSPLDQYFVPPYYSADYITIIEESKKEAGLVIYSVVPQKNWEPIIRAFNGHYPWVIVTTFELDSSGVFNHYYDAANAGIRSADIAITSDQAGWQAFFDKGEIFNYRSQEDLFVPEWSKSTIGISKAHTGLYTTSIDPMLIIYNQQMVTDSPSTLSAIATMSAADPARYREQVTTVDADLDAAGYATNWFWINRTGEAGWSDLNAIGSTKPILEPSSEAIVDAVGSGNMKVGYFASALSVFQKLDDYPDLGWSYITNGQPILLNSIAITRKAASPNSAKLMLDFILSQDGQLAIAKGGLTPYRNDIFGIPEHHINTIAQTIGDENLILFAMDERIMDMEKQKIFIERWRTAMQKTSPPTPTPEATPTP